MKTIHAAPLCSLLLLSLPGCFPDTPNTAADEAKRALEASQAAYQQQAAEMQRHSEDLQKQVAELQQNLKDKENAELKAKLDAIQRENDKLMADAAAAQKRSEELRDQLAAANTKPAPSPATPTVIPVPVPTPAPAPAPIANQPWSDPDADYSMFYNSLSPHGRWLELDGYGYAFRPTYADRADWRPYVDGRWVWTDQGWAWDTPEPIGWACYHYGRWVRISRHGWVWLPGRQWAPAWVSWRRSPDYIGWAPLPPSVGHVTIGHDCDARYGLAPTSYTFIQATHFGRSSYANVCISSSTIPTFFHQTLNVTQIVQVQHNNATLFMHRGGPELAWVEQRCGSPILRAPIQFSSILDRPFLRQSGSSVGMAGFLAAPMPTRRAGPGPSRPAVSERISRPVFDDDWKSIPEAIRGRLRDGIAQEARGSRPQPILTGSPPAVKKPMPLPELRPAPGKESGKESGNGGLGGISKGGISKGGISRPKDDRKDRDGSDGGNGREGIPGKSKLPVPEVRPGIPMPQPGMTSPGFPVAPEPGLTSPGFPDKKPIEKPQPVPTPGGMKGLETLKKQAEEKTRKEQENAAIARQEIERRRLREAEEKRRALEMPKQPTLPPTTQRPGLPANNNGGGMAPIQNGPKFQKPDQASLKRQMEAQQQLNLQRLKQQDALRRAQMEALQRQQRMVPQPTIRPPSQSPTQTFNNQGIRGSNSGQGMRGAGSVPGTRNGTSSIQPRKAPGFPTQGNLQPMKKPQN